MHVSLSCDTWKLWSTERNIQRINIMFHEIYVLKSKYKTARLFHLSPVSFVVVSHVNIKDCVWFPPCLCGCLGCLATKQKWDLITFLCSTSLGVLATRDRENARNRETEGLCTCIKVTTSFRTLPISRSVRTAFEWGSSVNLGHARSYVLLGHSYVCPCNEGRRYGC